MVSEATSRLRARAVTGTMRSLVVATWIATACVADEEAPREEIGRADRDPAAERTSSFDACELLTAGEIEAATGLAPGAPQDVSQVGGQLPMCHWPAADGSGRMAATVLVTRGGFAAYDAFVEATRSQLGAEFREEDWQHVDGVGDFGVWTGEDVGMLQVYRGGRMVQIGVEAADGRGKLDAARELARKALERVG